MKPQFDAISELASDDNFSSLFDLLPIGAYRSSPQGKQLRANSALVRMNGYGSEPAMLAGVQDIAREWYVLPHRRYEFMALMASKGRVTDFVSEVHRHKTRERIWVREHAHAVLDEDGEVLFYEGTVEDITQHRQIHERLRESEQRFRSLTDLSADWYWEQDADFRFTRYDGSQEKSGVPSEFALGRTRWELGALNLNEAAWNVHRAMLDAHMPFLDFEIQRNHPFTGNYWFSVSGNPVFDDMGDFKGYRGIGRNITARKKAMEMALENEALLKTLVQTIPDCVWLKSPEGVYLACNAAFEAHRGLPAASIIGKTDAEMLGAELTEHFVRSDRAALHTSRPVSFEVDYTKKSEVPEEEHGTFEVVKTAVRNAAGQSTGILGIGRDITARKRAEAHLRSATEQMELAIIGTELGLWHQDPERGDAIHMDSRGCLLLGLTVETYQETGGLMSLIHPDDVGAVRFAYQQHIEGKTPGYSVEFRARHQDGRWIWLQSRGRAVQASQNGKVVRVAGTLMDITERKKSEFVIRTQPTFTDVLTGLPTRRLLMDRLQCALEANVRNKQHGALMLVDLETVKFRNESLGYDQGNRLLQQVAERLKSSVRAVDTVARLGDDEFVVMVEDLSINADSAHEQARVVGEKIYSVLNEPFVLGDQSVAGATLIGTTLFNDTVHSSSEVLRRADMALNRARESGHHSRTFTAGA